MRLAETAAAAGDVPVGAVLVVGDLEFSACNEKERLPDPTAHAEMLVIRSAAQRLGVWRIGGTLYVTKEPCAMCAGAIAAARIERLVYGCADPKGGAVGTAIDVLGSSAVNHRVVVESGLLEDETAQQLRDYFRRKRDVRKKNSAQDTDAE